MKHLKLHQLIAGSAISLVLLSLVSSPASAVWKIDSLGDITIDDLTGLILGKTDNQGKNDNNDSQEESSPGNSSQAKAKVEVKTNDNNGKTEIKIKTQEKSTGSVKAVPVKDKLKVTLYDENNQVELEVDPETEGIQIEEDEDADTVSIRSKNNASYVIKNKVAAQSRFPIMVNLETNELMITTPKGTKTVTVLPDKAVENMLAANVLDQLGGKGGLQWLSYQEQLRQASGSGEMNRERNNDASGSADMDDADDADEAEDDTATDSGDLQDDTPATSSADTTPQVVDQADTVVDLVTTDDGTLAYEIEGVKNEKLLGLKDVKLNRKVVVSAETGELLQVVQDFRTQLLDFFSF